MPISFADELFLSRGQRSDWPRFARWHYRSHQIGLVRSIEVLWHGCPHDRDEVEPLFAEASNEPKASNEPEASNEAVAAAKGCDGQPRPIGIAVFVSAPMSLAGRNRFFGRRGRLGRLELRMLNRQLVLLQRLVLHPTYRGAGLATPFLARACDRTAERTGIRWVETLTELGQSHPVFERAGFTRVGRVHLDRSKRTRAGHSALFGGRPVSVETFTKSRHTAPTYLVRRCGEVATQ